MQRLAFRSEYLSPLAKNEMRAKTERKPLNAKCLHTLCYGQVFLIYGNVTFKVSPQTTFPLNVKSVGVKMYPLSCNTLIEYEPVGKLYL